MAQVGPEHFAPNTETPAPKYEEANANPTQAQALDGEVFRPNEEIPTIPAPYEPQQQDRIIGSAIPLFLRGIDVKSINSRTTFVKALSQNIILNEYGLPVWYYRPDTLDWTRLAHCPLLVEPPESGDWSELESMVNGSIVQLNYDQGFPAQENGQPFWGQLPHESKDAYTTFMEYLTLPGARNISDIQLFPLDLLHDWFYQNYWHHRAIAMDVFRAAHHERLREQRIMTLEGQHWEESNKLFRRISDALGRKEDKDLDGMDPMQLVKMMREITQLQRSSVGLSPLGTNLKDERNITSVEVTARRVAEQRIPSKPQDIEESDFDQALLRDPDIIEQAQSLIIKVNRG